MLSGLSQFIAECDVNFVIGQFESLPRLPLFIPVSSQD
jgi:hypothetical protein